MPTKANPNQCAGCGMTTETPAEYHPWVACELFKAIHHSRQVRGNLTEVVRYGMRAQELGVSLEDAMADISKVVR